MDWKLILSGLVATGGPVIATFIGSWYLGWKAKKLADGVHTFADDAISFIDSMIDAVDGDDDEKPAE